MTENTSSPLGNVITIDDERIKNHNPHLWRNALLQVLQALCSTCKATAQGRGNSHRDAGPRSPTPSRWGVKRANWHCRSRWDGLEAVRLMRHIGGTTVRMKRFF
jgi:hypothetical protein